ncbi:UDP-N-acetyl-D-mannosamine dehydrogenase [Telmatospirillum sp.]|uniref:UDP-N-acetyl-D-mannosamine dehydrogenase n=1 Tax=Telmatospirillum sp. TaxID=2079197 RepID=UPI00283DF268|nr:UDP-N-acetyl-D-mannosamine dehydrogenase [Telmatospirillum sp.]MDR3437633.1 UDP-N-acetyl-D-mannosamine dehydrogenase [Telmatospirillum sp.]
MTSICVLGLGYIGLPTAALLASHGHRVYGVDVRPDIVETVSAGRVHITEADLDGLVQKVVNSGLLTAHHTPCPADAFIITTPTPLTEDRRPQLDFVFAAADSIAPLLKRGDIVIVESTCPVGTTRNVAKRLADARPDLAFAGGGAAISDVSVAYCPERVLPGRILIELIDNDRCVGGLTPVCTERAAQLYESFVRGTVLRTDAATAELVKLTENAFRDVNIAFANELSMVADHHGVDVWKVIKLANRHPRVNILSPGPGVGGHCIAVDPWFIVDAAPEQAKLIRVAREVNDRKADYVFERLAATIETSADKTITCFGLAFKPNVDDLRESPAMEIVERLGRAFPGKVAAVEPFIHVQPPALKEAGVPLITLEEGLNRSGAFVLLVDHTAFLRVPSERLGGRKIFDTRGGWGRV